MNCVIGIGDICGCGDAVRAFARPHGCVTSDYGDVVVLHKLSSRVVIRSEVYGHEIGNAPEPCVMAKSAQDRCRIVLDDEREPVTTVVALVRNLELKGGVEG